MFKLIIVKIYKPIPTIFIARQKKKNKQKMMKEFLKIKSGKFCAIYNKS